MASASRAAPTLLAAALTAALALSPRAAAAPDDAPRRLRHLLRYVASDYRRAVSAGEIRNQAEYDEQRTLLESAAKLAAALAPEHPSLPPAIARIDSLVAQRSPEPDLLLAVARADALLVAAFKLRDTPPDTPDLARGESLYREHCATCHGPAGHADTPRARSLTPPPPDYHDPVFAEAMSPLRVAAAVELGIEGTSMVPFTFLTEQDRWNIAFFVPSLRHAPLPSSPSVPLRARARRDHGRRSPRRSLRRRSSRARPPRSPRRSPHRPPASLDTPLSRARAELSESRVQWLHGSPDRADPHLRRACGDLPRSPRSHLAARAPEPVADMEQRCIAARASSPPLPSRRCERPPRPDHARRARRDLPPPVPWLALRRLVLPHHLRCPRPRRRRRSPGPHLAPYSNHLRPHSHPSSSSSGQPPSSPPPPPAAPASSR
ncbi:MAG: cytochrome c [Polyangiaceae bacterium]